MRTTIIFSAFITLSYLLQSCCKAMCTDYGIVSFEFQGFNSNELQKVKVIQYNHDDFMNPLDSFYVNTSNVVFRDTTVIPLYNPLTKDFDFKIVVENANAVYSLTDIQVGKEKCNCGPGTTEHIVGYRLNGVLTMERSGRLILKK